MHISFVVPGRIRGKGRPRATVRGGFARVYTDVKTKSDEAMVKHFASLAMAGRPPIEGPLVLAVSIVLNTPPSWSKKKRAAAIHATGKPDLDNILKLVGDSLNGIVWGDDSQISELRMRRVYNDTMGESATISVYSPVRTAEEFFARCEAPLFAERASA